MGRLAVREIADTIDVADPLRPVRAIECDPVVGAIMGRTLPHRPDKIFDGADNFVEPAECFHELDVPDGVVPPDVAEAVELMLIDAECIVGDKVGKSEAAGKRSEEHTSELQSLMRSSYAVFCFKKNINSH